MKKIIAVLFMLITAMLVAACGGETAATNAQNDKMAAERTDTAAGVASYADGKKILVAYFSRAGENYAVGNIEKLCTVSVQGFSVYMCCVCPDIII